MCMRSKCNFEKLVHEVFEIFFLVAIYDMKLLKVYRNMKSLVASARLSLCNKNEAPLILTFINA